MPMCKKCEEVVGAIEIDEEGLCKKCASTSAETNTTTSKKKINNGVVAEKNNNSVMKIILYILAALAILDGSSMIAQATSAIHQILAYIAFLIAAIFLSAAAIIGAIKS